MAHTRSARLGLAAVAAGLAVLTACGASAEEQPVDSAAAQEHQGHDQHQGEPQGPAPHQHDNHHGGGGLQLWATMAPALGTITLDGAGRIVYRSDADSNNPPVSNCAGECTQRWVPVTVPEGQKPDLLGIKPEQVGTFRREDGTQQVTLAGWPLYTVAGDQGAHDGIGANGAEGLWFAVTPTGEKAMP